MKKPNPVMKVLYWISDNVSVVSGVALCTIVVSTLADVILRLFNTQIVGNIEIIQHLMVVVVVFSFGKATLEDQFTKVEVFNFGKAEKAIKFIMDLIHIVLSVLATYFCFQQGLVTKSIGTSSQMRNIQRWPFLILMGVGFILVAVSVVIRWFIKPEKTSEEIANELAEEATEQAAAAITHDSQN